MKKYPRSAAIRQQNVLNQEKNFVAALNQNGEDVTEEIEMFKNMTNAIDSYEGIMRSKASYYFTDYSDLDTNISSRPGLTNREYNYFRPEEAKPTKFPQIFSSVNQIYRENGLIRNVTDIMGDFASQGVRLSHPNVQVQRFYRRWFKSIEGQHVTERLANILVRLNNAVIQRGMGKLTKRQAQKMRRVTAAAREIPANYTFLNPSIVNPVGGPLSSFFLKKRYSIRIPSKYRMIINSPDAKERAVVNQLPDYIKKAAEAGRDILLPEDNTIVYHYKKDDWCAWAYPTIYSIMDDITLYHKMKLADKAALDGAISNIRIFKLGNLEHKIPPSNAAVAKLSEILENHMGGGTLDLIWGPDIELVESKTTVHQFLGEAKYQPVLNAIYAGLGIPPTLTGTFGASGTTNNYISLQTLIQRLEYIRGILIDFWETEIAIVQKAMGFQKPAVVEFRYPNLGDTAAMYNLLLNMADRGIISHERVNYEFGHDPELERIRTKKENKERDSGKRVPQASPYHDPQFMIALKKIALQTGVVAPSEVGMELEERKEGETSALDLRSSQIQQKAEKVGEQGRPKNSKDSGPRKQKDFKPKIKAEESLLYDPSKFIIESWANTVQEAVTEYLMKLFLNAYNKKNMRQLTAKQFQKAEEVKFGVLCNMEPLQTINEKDVLEMVRSKKIRIPAQIKTSLLKIKAKMQEELGRDITVKETRAIQSFLYASMKS